MPPNNYPRSLSNLESETTRKQFELYKREEFKKLANAISTKKKEPWSNRIKYGILLGILVLFAVVFFLPSPSLFDNDTTNPPPSSSSSDDDDTTNTPPANVTIDISKIGNFYKRQESENYVNEGEIARKWIVEVYWNVYEIYDFDNVVSSEGGS